MKPGIYAGISNADYHGGAGISKSGLDLVARSPLHYWQAYLNPDREPREETPAMRLGTAIHTAMLEPERFADEYVIVPADAPRRPTSVQLNAKNPSDATLQAIAWWDSFDIAAQGKTIISADDYETCAAISRRLHAHPAAAVLLRQAGALFEASAYWEDPDTGVLCRCRPDVLLPNGAAVVDVKSTTDASADAFRRSVANYDYHVQAAFYLDGITRATGTAPGAFVFAAFETSAPHAVAFYNADATMLDIGRREYKRRLRRYAQCLASGTWPGYADTIQNLQLPPWVIAAANDNNPNDR